MLDKYPQLQRMRILPWAITILAFLFLYAPIVVLVIYSFNASSRVAIWGGWSTKWYAELLHNQDVLTAALKSLQIALSSATIGTIIGLLGAYALIRLGRFWSRPILSATLAAPLVMPEVITGISMLLLFIAMEQFVGWPNGRGMLTIIIAHSTFCAAYVSIIIMSRLRNVDRSIEEAALDLGAKPYHVFMDVTFPAIATAILSGWLLAFTLSLDDLVIASFVSGPSSSTLPMLIFSKVRFGVSPEINALASLVILIVSLSLATAWFLQSRNKH